jgi:hypothetical protein
MGRGVQRGLNFNNHIGHIHNRVWPLFFEILCTIYLIESIKKSVWAGLRNDVLKIWAAEPVKPEAAGSSPVAPANKSRGYDSIVAPFSFGGPEKGEKFFRDPIFLLHWPPSISALPNLSPLTRLSFP